jgi:hypothetical protein
VNRTDNLLQGTSFPSFFFLHKQKQHLISAAVFGSKVLSLKIKEHEGKTGDAN